MEKFWKDKEVEDISLLMFVLLVIGLTLLIFYGAIQNDIALIITNGT